MSNNRRRDFAAAMNSSAANQQAFMQDDSGQNAEDEEVESVQLTEEHDDASEEEAEEDAPMGQSSSARPAMAKAPRSAVAMTKAPRNSVYQKNMSLRLQNQSAGFGKEAWNQVRAQTRREKLSSRALPSRSSSNATREIEPVTVDEVEQIWDKRTSRINLFDFEYYVSFKHFTHKSWVSSTSDLILRALDLVQEYEQGPVAQVKNIAKPFLDLTVAEILSYAPRPGMPSNQQFYPTPKDRRGVYPNVDYKMALMPDSPGQEREIWVPESTTYAENRHPVVTEAGKHEFETTRAASVIGYRASRSDASTGSSFIVPNYSMYRMMYTSTLTQAVYDRAITDQLQTYSGFFESSGIPGIAELQRYGYKQCFQDIHLEGSELWTFPDNCNKMEWFLKQRVRNATGNCNYKMSSDFTMTPMGDANTNMIERGQMWDAGAKLVQGTVRIVFSLYLHLEMDVKLKVAGIKLKVAKDKTIYLAEFFNTLNMYDDKAPSRWRQFLFDGTPLSNVSAVFLSMLLPKVDEITRSADFNAHGRKVSLYAFSLMRGRQTEAGRMSKMSDLTGYYGSLGFSKKEVKQIGPIRLPKGTQFMDSTIENVLSTIAAKRNENIDSCRRLVQSAESTLDALTKDKFNEVALRSRVQPVEASEAGEEEDKDDEEAEDKNEEETDEDEEGIDDVVESNDEDSIQSSRNVRQKRAYGKIGGGFGR